MGVLVVMVRGQPELRFSSLTPVVGVQPSPGWIYYEDTVNQNGQWVLLLNLLNLVFSPLKVMEAEQTKTRSELVHKETAAKYNAAMGRMKQLEKKLKRAINKSK